MGGLVGYALTVRRTEWGCGSLVWGRYGKGMGGADARGGFRTFPGPPMKSWATAPMDYLPDRVGYVGHCPTERAGTYHASEAIVVSVA